MYKFSANYIYLGNGEILKYGIIKLNEEGKITEIVDTKGVLKEEAGMQFYGGIIVPGFVNTHCHLELSHLRGEITKHTHLHGFIKELQSKRKQLSLVEIQKAAQIADKRMRAAGIVAVGDISNDAYTIPVKANSSIKYINFIETFGTNFEKAQLIFSEAKKLQKEFTDNKLTAFVVPHAPYSLSKELFELIKHNSVLENAIQSIHNQETPSENDLLSSKTGELFEMFSSWGLNMNYIEHLAESSLKYFAKKMNHKSKTLLIHNTFTKAEDIVFAKNHFEQLYWAFCPKANLYIENQLPDVSVFRENNCTICLGTDSLASNDSLSILDEMLEIQKVFPEIPFSELLQWATINGAKALGLEQTLGSIEIGKTPGLNLISNFDFKNNNISSKSKVTVLI